MKTAPDPVPSGQKSTDLSGSGSSSVVITDLLLLDVIHVSQSRWEARSTNPSLGSSSVGSAPYGDNSAVW